MEFAVPRRRSNGERIAGRRFDFHDRRAHVAQGFGGDGTWNVDRRAENLDAAEDSHAVSLACSAQADDTIRPGES
jgi:hypothetical protein